LGITTAGGWIEKADDASALRPRLLLQCFCLPFWWFAFVLFTVLVDLAP
jgi:hypothetical protein